MAVELLKYRIDVEANQAKAELRGTEHAIDETSDAAKNLGKDLDRLEKKFGTSFRVAVEEATKAERATEKLEKQVDELGKAKDRTTKKTSELTSTLMRYAGPAALGLALKASADYADRLEEMAVQTGMTIRSLQQFDYAAKLNGSSLESVTRAAGVFQDRLAGGDKSVLRALEKVGISFDAIRAKTPDQQMLELARAITGIEDPALKANVAMDLFGRSGVALIPTLKAIVDNGNNFPAMSDKAVKSAGQLSDAWDRLKTAGLALVGNVFAPIGPIVNTLAGLVEGAVNRIGSSISVLIGPIGLLTDYYDKISFMWDQGAPKAPAPPTWLQDLMKGNTGGQPDVFNLLGSDQFNSYTNEITKQLNDQLREQSRLHVERAKAGEEASRKLKKAAEDELAAFNALISANRSAVSEAQRVLGEDFDLFFGRGFDARGNPMQGQNYWGLTGLPSTSLGGVMGPIQGPQSAGNIAGWINGGQPGRRPNDGGSAQSQWFQDWQQNYGDYSSWGSGATSFGNAFATYGQAAQDISRGDTQVLRATNVAGRGNRALGGAIAGAQEGGQYGGPYGAAGGAVVGLIIGLVRNPGFEDVMNRVAHQLGEGISEELARTIDDLGKANEDRGWGRSEAEVRSMGAIIGEIGVTDENFDTLIRRTRDLFSALETGRFTAEEARDTLDETFGFFADHVLKSERLASKSFQELIALNQQFGLESEAVRQFVEGQTASLGSSIAALAAPLVQEYGGLAAAIDVAKEAVSGFVAEGRAGTEDHAKAVAKLTELQATQAEGATKGAEELERLGLIAVAAFNASLEAGTDYLTAIDAMGPALDTLIGLQQDLGIESENAALKELTAFRDRVNANRTLITATEALGQTMRALASIGGLTTETLAAMEAQGLTTFQRLRDAGFSEHESLRLMKDFILNVIEAHEQLGVPIDDNMAALINMADQYGLLQDDGTSMIDVLKGGFETLTQGINRLIETLGGVPLAINGIADAVDNIPSEIDIGVNVVYNDPGYQTPEQQNAYVVAGGYVGAHGVQYLDTGGRVLGFRPRGTDTVPAMLTPGEGVLSRRGMQALGALNRGEAGGGHITIEKGAIVITGVSDPEEVVDLVMQRLKQRTKYGTAA